MSPCSLILTTQLNPFIVGDPGTDKQRGGEKGKAGSSLPLSEVGEWRKPQPCHLSSGSTLVGYTNQEKIFGDVSRNGRNAFRIHRRGPGRITELANTPLCPKAGGSGWRGEFSG